MVLSCHVDNISIFKNDEIATRRLLPTYRKRGYAVILRLEEKNRHKIDLEGIQMLFGTLPYPPKLIHDNILYGG